MKPKARELADALIKAYAENPDYDFVLLLCRQCQGRIDHIIWKRIVLPELTRRMDNDPSAIRGMIETIQNLYSSRPEHEALNWVSEGQLTLRLLNMTPDDPWAKKQRVAQLRQWLAHTIHEWPAGVLYGMDGASMSECDEILVAVGELRSREALDNTLTFCKEVEKIVSSYKERLAKTVQPARGIACETRVFPLIWRWTSARHASFSESELAGLRPCSPTEAARIHDDSLLFDLRDGLNQHHFRSIRVQAADVSVADGCSWLRTQAEDLSEQVTVSWDRETALRTSWEFFTKHWDDFCYPASDDVLVLPDSGSWVLRYHHEEIFYFGDHKLRRVGDCGSGRQ